MRKKMHSGAIKPLFQMARELRNKATNAETTLWSYLRTKPLGFKFRRQHPFSIYILDFYCHSLNLDFEVDGSIHNLPEIKLNDENRQSLLQQEGLTALRFTNDQIEKEFENVIKQIENLLIEHCDGKQR